MKNDKKIVITEQARANSPLFWVGALGCIAQIICGVLAANNLINEETASAIMCGMGGLFLWCNANNPSIKNELESIPETDRLPDEEEYRPEEEYPEEEYLPEEEPEDPEEEYLPEEEPEDPEEGHLPEEEEPEESPKEV